MIPLNATLSEQDDLPGEETEFTIGDPRWVMRSMSDLYSNRELAVTREYSTNAYDEHVKYDLNRPIEVTLPSAFNRSFTVRDFGIGMSKSDLQTIYTKFGTSTKQGSNDFNGMLGFGSKAAAAYTDTFKVTSVRDGMKTSAIITRKADWSIVLKVLAHAPSDDESGTLVEVPVHNPEEFAAKANDFYAFWRPGTVLVNGVEPKQRVGEQLTEDLYYSDNDYSYVVMGNVPYRIENASALFYNKKMHEISFVAYIGNGLVEFTPNREALKYTDHTKDTLAKVVSDFEAEMLSRGKAEIAAAKTHYEAYEAWNKWTQALGSSLFSELTFKGDKLTTHFKIDGVRYRPDSYGASTRKIESHMLSDLNSTLIITDYQYVLSSSHKSQAREYAKQKGRNFRHYLFTKDKQVSSPWVNPEHCINWEDLKTALPPKPKKQRSIYGGPGRVKGKFDFWSGTTLPGKKIRWNVEADIPAGSELFYVTTRQAKQFSIDGALMHLPVDVSKFAVVKLASNRIEKFTRDNPKARDFIDFATKHVVLDGASLISAETKEAMSVDWQSKRWLELVDVNRLDDPKFKRLKTLVAKPRNLERYQSNEALASALGMRYNGQYKPYHSAGSVNVFSDYSLLTEGGFRTHLIEHIYIYMNAWYQAKKGK